MILTAEKSPLYCKNEKIRAPEINWCEYPKIWTMWRYHTVMCVYSGLTSLSTIFQSYHGWLRQGAQCSLYTVMCPKDAYGMANSVDPDQTWQTYLEWQTVKTLIRPDRPIWNGKQCRPWSDLTDLSGMANSVDPDQTWQTYLEWQTV